MSCKYRPSYSSFASKSGISAFHNLLMRSLICDFIAGAYLQRPVSDVTVWLMLKHNIHPVIVSVAGGRKLAAGAKQQQAIRTVDAVLQSV